MLVDLIWGTKDSYFLLLAGSAMLASSVGSLKCLADLQFGSTTVHSFLRNMEIWFKVETTSLVFNAVACLPFLSCWWLAWAQMAWTAYKFSRVLRGTDRVKGGQPMSVSNYLLLYREMHVRSLFVHLTTWFFYFSCFVTAVLDVLVHGVSPWAG